MEILAKLFGTASKVKIMRLFLFNPGTAYDFDDIKDKTRVNISTVRKITRMLESIGFLKQKSYIKKVKKSRGRGRQPVFEKKKIQGWSLDTEFPFLATIYKLLVTNDPFTHKEILKKFANAGKVKLIVISGVFIQEWESRVDLLIVGEKLKKGLISQAVKTMESEIGKELTYAVFDEKEFMYRLNVYDKLVRDILDYPHEVIYDKMNIKTLTR